MAQPQYNIFQDWRTNKNNIKGSLVLLMFRLFILIRHAHPILIILGLPYLILYRLGIEWMFGIELPWNLEIGENTQLYQGHSLLVHYQAKNSADTILKQSTTIGAKIYSNVLFYYFSTSEE